MIVMVTSGTPGAGKTTVAINLAVALAGFNRRVCVVDAALGCGDVIVRLGMSGGDGLGDVVFHGRNVRDLLAVGPHGIRVLPDGLKHRGPLTARESNRLEVALEAIADRADFVIVDTGAGSPKLIETLADRTVVVTSIERRAADATAALVRRLSGLQPLADLGLVVNGVHDDAEGDVLFGRLDRIVRRSSRCHLEYYGHVAFDPEVRRALMRQRAVVECRPHAPASRCFRALATRLSERGPSGGADVCVAPGPPALGLAVEVLECA